MDVNHPYIKSLVVYLDGYIFESLFGYHDILMLDKSSIKWRQRPDMTIGVDLIVKHQFKQTNKQARDIHKRY